jgi:hypothetical protein
MTIIYCPVCMKPCGKEYPDCFIPGGSWDQGYAEGIGENNVYKGLWHCSQACVDITKGVSSGE